MRSLSFRKMLASVVVCVTLPAQAALMDTGNGSFIDQNSGLEWLQFGNSYRGLTNKILDDITNGTDVDGWRLPSLPEVLALLENNFSGLGAELDSPLIETGAYYARYRDTTSGDSVFESLFDTLGHNLRLTSESRAAGWFYADNNQLVNLYFTDYDSGDDFIQVYGRDQNLSASNSITNSPLLVKGQPIMPIVDMQVDEPKQLFALGLISLMLLSRLRR